ncbi:serine/threonine-protein kinase [Vulgatibacter sp.]|uniref:serine/threonine-protein kinase n=1 Tax=Vulgatibacter sp. TaxID=1971226 RepID=UPI00356268AF
MFAFPQLRDRLGARIPELRALLRWPIFVLYVQRVRASVIAMCAHLAFMTLLLEPLLAWLIPPPAQPSGLLAIFSGPKKPAPHEEVLVWLDPLLWVLSWAAFCIFLERSIKPALARARERSRELQAQAEKKIERGELVAGVTMLAEAAAVMPEKREQERIEATLAQVRSTWMAAKATGLATAVGPGTVGEPTTSAATAVQVGATAVQPAAAAAPAEKQRPSMAGGRLTVDRQLGAGAMGRVFAATDQLLGRRLAVKELADGVATDPTYRERFLREARVLARLSHANIVQVFDLLDEGSRFYLCMELVEGDSLETLLLERGRLAVAEAAAIGQQIAAALAYAHGKGVIHRDLKPANVLVAAGGLVKVVDFGVARLVDSRMTRTGMVIGTPVYMAPEQIQGGVADERADLYALGVLLYELASGQPPFDGNFAALLTRHLTEVPKRLVLEPADAAGEAYADLVAALLAKDPAERPASAQEVVGKLAPLAAAAAA